MQLIYFAAVPWASFRQRPHEFAQWAHDRLGARVLWVEPYPVRLPALQDLSRPRVTAPSAAEPAWLQVVAPRALPAEPTAWGRWLNGTLFWPSLLARLRAFASADRRTVIAVGKPSHLALEAMKALDGVPAFYDAMDDFPAFHHGRARATAARIEGEIVDRCVACSTSSTLLATRMRQRKARVVMVANGLAADRMPPPATPHTAARSFGYVGTLGPWFDWGWLGELAAAWPDCAVDIHGPVYRKPTLALPPNVTLHPPLPHEAALEKMNGFAAGLIPFLRNELTASVDPVKFYEYRALGLPVVSTPFGEMLQRAADPRVVLTDEPAAQSARIGELLSARDTAESVAAFRGANDWRVRFEPLAALLSPDAS